MLYAVLAIAVAGCATPVEPVERMQTSVSSSLVRSFEQLVKATAAAVPDAPAILLQVKALPQRRWTRAEQLAIALEAGPPLAPPGDLFHYSDTGYILLGEVIEVVTGAPLPAAIRRTLDFERLGLRDTWFESLEPIPPHAPARQLQLLDGIDAMRFDASIDL